ncbi:hypothetical protein TcBrA4_0069250 [Trypanosoma cruzi]|nr:hypothetical protein TcBrA4_0069250 [Trypanosoma cruzi]
MPSPHSLNSVQAFLGNLPVESVREDLEVEDVPQNDEGLRLMAADANWSGVLLLAERLGAEADADTIQGLACKLRYTLVQVTAYFSMQRYAAAKSWWMLWEISTVIALPTR